MDGLDNEHEEDPRKFKSEPASPGGQAAAFDKNIFRNPDNVYADSKPPNPLGKIGKTYSDFNAQIDSDYDEIMARKGGDIVNFEGND